MDLKIKDVAELLSVSETTIRRWLSEGKIPAYRLHHQYRFSRTEIEDWMMSCRLEQEGEEKPEMARKGMNQFSLYRAMHRGEVLTDLVSDSKEALIKEVMNRVAKDLGMDAEVMTEMLLDRERMMPTALSNGVAVPHTRDFLLKKPYDVVVVASLEQRVDWGALDGKKVHTLFFLFASDDKRHLNLLAKLAHLSSSDEALEFLQTRCPKGELLEYIKGWEAKIRYLNT